jgi:hypothetical protein
LRRAVPGQLQKRNWVEIVNRLETQAELERRRISV